MCSVDNRTQNKRKLFDDCWTFWAISDDRENCISRSWPVDDAKESREKYTTTKQIKWQTRNTSTNANHYSMLIKFCRVWSFVLFATEVKNVRVQFRKGTAHTESQSWSRKNQRQNNKKEFISTRIDFHVDQWQRQRQRQSNKKTIQQCGAIHGVTCLNRIMRKPKKNQRKEKNKKYCHKIVDANVFWIEFLAVETAAIKTTNREIVERKLYQIILLRSILIGRTGALS